MQPIDQNKLAAVFVLLEGDSGAQLRAWLTLGVDPFLHLDTQENYERRAGAAAAAFLRDLLNRLEQQVVQLGLADQPAVRELLDQQAKQPAVGVGLHCGDLPQRVEGARRDV